MRKILPLILCFIFIVNLISCAKRGYISGGDKDTIPPVILYSNPLNYTTNFDKKFIRIQFNEYIKLKNINQQLIISPPMENDPEIKPMGSAKKALTIKIVDTLKPNTTYSFNFGESIIDNNEGNPYKQFKYIFSTGDYVDSLKVNGFIKDAYKKNPSSSVTVMLYETKNFKDSTIYKEKPYYITNTSDSVQSFSIENIKEGNYYLFALKDKNNNYKYDTSQDEIAFLNDSITVPTEENFILNLFKAKEKFKFIRPSQISQNKWYLPYNKKHKDLDLQIKDPENKNIEYALTTLKDTDSLQIWFPKIEVDSLLIHLKDTENKETFTVRPRNIKTIDSLSISTVQKGTLDFGDIFTIKTSTPFTSIDSTRVQITNKDSLAVPFKIKQDAFLQEIYFDFEKEEQNLYKVLLLPDAITDFFGKKNDSITFSVNTKQITDYGNLFVKLSGVKKFPIIIELLDNKEKVIYSSVIHDEKESPVHFKLLPPRRYLLRAIYDDNNNGEWDTGDYLEHKQPEEVIYLQSEIDIRANWDIEQVFNLGGEEIQDDIPNP